MHGTAYFEHCGRLLHSQYSHIKNCKREINTSYDRVVTKTEAEKKNMWLYECCFDIISRNEIQVKLMHSYLSSEKDIVSRLLILILAAE